MLSNLAQAALVRVGTRFERASVSRIGAIMPLPAVADDRVRVSGELRKTADAVCERMAHAYWVEVRLQAENGGVSPAILLLAEGSLVAACLQGDVATLLIAPGVESVTIARRLRDVSTFAAALATTGYDTRVHPLHQGAQETMTTAEWMESLDSRSFRRGWPVDAAIVFTAGAVLSGVSLAMGAPGASRAGVLVGALALGGLCAAMQFLHSWNQWHERLISFRVELAAQAADAESVEFHPRPTPLWMRLSAFVLFGGVAVGLARGGDWGLALVALGTAVSLQIYLLVLDRAWVRLDATGIEGLALRRRVRMSFVDVDAIPATDELEPMFVVSRRDRIWLSKQLAGGEHLRHLLWERVLRAHSSLDLARQDLGEPRLLRALRDAVERSRASGTIVSTRLPSLPWLLRLAWRDPVLEQYRWQQHLVRHGRVCAARVVSSSMAFEVPRDRLAGPLSVRVLFLDPDHGSTTRLAVECLNQALQDDAVSPPLLDALTRVTPAIRQLPPERVGPGVWVARMVLDPRALPLRHLRSAWLPVLVDRGRCDFVSPVPPALWPPPFRRAWLAGGPDAVAGQDETASAGAPTRPAASGE